VGKKMKNEKKISIDSGIFHVFLETQFSAFGLGLALPLA
jgi:hypothetical protein